jgi:hypothetical protein
MTEEAAQALREQQAAFRAKFGRDPGPRDPVFFDPEADHPVAISEEKLMDTMVDALRQFLPQDERGFALAHAYKKTGLIVTEMNQHLIPPEDRQAWQEAFEEGRRLYRDAN